jgi:hypothetical protein
VAALGTTEITGSRLKSALASVGALGFVALGVMLLRDPDLAGNTKATLAAWGAIVFFGAVAPLGLLAVISPRRLVLTPQGFSISRPLREPRSLRWSDIEEPYIFQVRSTRVVSYRYRPGREPSDILTRMNASLGAPGSFGGYWRIGPEELLELALRYHRAANA